MSDDRRKMEPKDGSIALLIVGVGFMAIDILICIGGFGSGQKGSGVFGIKAVSHRKVKACQR